MTLGDRIYSTMKKRNIKQKDLAERIGVSRTQLSKYSNDLVEPKASTIKKLAKELDVSADYLLGLDDGEQAKVIASEIIRYFEERGK